MSKSFAQLSLPTCLEISSKAVADNSKLSVATEADADKDDDADVDVAVAAVTTSNVLVVVAKAPIKAYTQFGPLQVGRTDFFKRYLSFSRSG